MVPCTVPVGGVRRQSQMSKESFQRAWSLRVRRFLSMRLFWPHLWKSESDSLRGFVFAQTALEF